MSQQKNFFDQIGPYLDNQLSQGEKLEFDQQLQEDPLLKGEFQFQEDVIHSIREHRKLELKSRLDNIIIAPPPTSFVSSNLTNIKIVSSIVMISAIGIASYFYFQDGLENEAVSSDAVELIASEAPETFQTQIPEKSEIIIEQNQVADAQESAKMPEEVNPLETKDSKVTVKEEIAPPKTATTSNANRSFEPAIIEDFDDEESLPGEEEVALATRPTMEANVEEISKLEVSNKSDGKHSFHYQHYNNKLFLHGEFNDIPYEILELNKVDSKKLFLFYQNDFYDIKNNQVEIAPLLKIEDQKLIERLRIIRKNTE